MIEIVVIYNYKLIQENIRFMSFYSTIDKEAFDVIDLVSILMI